MLSVVSPVDGRIYARRPSASGQRIAAALEAATGAQASWKEVPVEERVRYCGRAVEALVAKRDSLAEEITWQMGRPIRFSPREVDRLEDRARHMLATAPQALADIEIPQKPGFGRFIRRQPLGIVFVVAPWNYPYLTSVNSLIPALVAGNAVILKQSTQTLLCAERYGEAFAEAGLPAGVFQYLHLDHADTERIIGSGSVDFVSFTGSVAGGRMVERAVAGRFIGAGLELGGKDPAFVRPDADLEHAAGSLADGAFFNSGQSCCAVERIYVHQEIFSPFVDAFAAKVRRLRLGDPLAAETTLGPMVRAEAADFVRRQVAEALGAGASALIDPAQFPADAEGTPYLAPQVLIGVDHSMAVMREETFGPVAGIMKVASDEEAVRLMNDSKYGLTASVWTADDAAAARIGSQVDTGTWYMNICDDLDPALAWTGIKDSGRGCTLSVLGYDQLTRPKSFHLKTAEPRSHGK